MSVNKSFGQISGISSGRLKTGNIGKTALSTPKAKKRLNYNSKEISSQLMRAKKSGNASMVLAKAKSRLGSLSRHLGSGQYDEKEVGAAIAHAKRMVKVARLKVSNLRKEERMTVDNERKEFVNELQKSNELSRRVSKRKQEIRAEIMIEETTILRKEKASERELMLKKHMNRQTELGEITKADIEYLKSKIENGTESNQIDTGGVVFELSTSAASLQELALLEKQLEQQMEVEMQIQMEMINEALVIRDLNSASLSTGSEFTNFSQRN